jgi:hypothetical protein
MKSLFARRRLIGMSALALVAITATATVSAAVGQPRTDGDRYDRNPSVLNAAGTTYLFFARSQSPCNRLAGCDPDQIPTRYDIYVKLSTNGGKDFGPATLVAANTIADPTFRGRTIAATANGSAITVFWANGGSQSALYYVTGTGTSFSAPAPVAGPDLADVFNVEAITRAGVTYLYTEESDLTGPYGVYARTFAAGAASAPTLVSANKNLPKGIVDSKTGQIRLTYVDASSYPTVDVLVNTSTDGLAFASELVAVHEPGVSHWDPQLVQRPNGEFELHSAPDAAAGAAEQQIAETKSKNFVDWKKTHEITSGQKGHQTYWDYWPEASLRGNEVVLYYTSERATKTTPAGTGHIWTDPGFGGLD